MTDAGSTNWDIASVIDAIGEPEFPVCLLGTLNQLSRIDHVGLFAFNDRLAPLYVAGHSKTRIGITDEANADYQAGGYFQHDPNRRIVGARPTDNQGILFTRQRVEDIIDPDYRAKIYERYDLAERVSLIDQRNGRWFTINLYRDRPTGAFSNEDVERLQRHAVTIAAITAKHLSLHPPADWTSATRPPVEDLETKIGRLTSDGGAKLSAREIQVCARAVLGLTGEGIALDLGVKQSTVATLRKRAYAKLNISTVHELFALCLGLGVGD